MIRMMKWFPSLGLGGIHSGPQVHMGEYIGCMDVHESAIPSLDIHSGHPQRHLSIPSIPNFKALAGGTTVGG